MPTIPEQISKMIANSKGKPDANLAQDSNNLGGIPAEDWATKQWVKEYHDNKEEKLKEYIDEQDKAKLEEAKSYTDTMIRNQDFSDFAKDVDVSALENKLNKKIEDGDTNQKKYTDQEISKVVGDVNTNFGDTGKAIQGLNDKISELQKKDTSLDGEIKNLKAKDESHDKSIASANTSISSLNTKYDDLFTSVSNGKRKIAEAITDKGVATSADSSFDVMAINIKSITTGGGSIPPGYIDTSMGTATASDIKLGKIAFSKGSIIIGTHIEEGYNTQDATATPYDILQGKTAYTANGKITGLLTLESGESGNNEPTYRPGDVKFIYGTRANDCSLMTYSFEAGSELSWHGGDGKYTLMPIMTTDDKISEMYCFNVIQDKNYKYNIIEIYKLEVNSSIFKKISEYDLTTKNIEDIGVMSCSNYNIEYPYIAITFKKPSEGSSYLGIIPIQVRKGEDISLNLDLFYTCSQYLPIASLDSHKKIQSSIDGKRLAVVTDSLDYMIIVFNIDRWTAEYVNAQGAKESRGNIITTFWANDNLFIVQKQENERASNESNRGYVHYFILYSEREDTEEGIIENNSAIYSNTIRASKSSLAVTLDGKTIIGATEENYNVETYIHNYNYRYSNLSFDYSKGEIYDDAGILVGRNDDNPMTTHKLSKGMIKEDFCDSASYWCEPSIVFLSDNLFLLSANSVAKKLNEEGTYCYNYNEDFYSEVPSFSFFEQKPFRFAKKDTGYSYRQLRDLYTIQKSLGENWLYVLDMETRPTKLVVLRPRKNFSEITGIEYKGETYYKSNKRL